MTKKRIFLIALLLVILLPCWMWLAWVWTPRKKMVVAIVDKTVLTPAGQEHISLDWVLRHEKFSKTKNDLYQPDRDYFGFFPGSDDHFRLKGLERFLPEQLKNLSNDADLVYFADTYGIYKNEWYRKTALTERSGMVYGGMSQQDIDLLSNMKAKHKLVIAEFNSIGSPTAAPIRSRFESLFQMHWSGWTGRYFSSLDTSINKELPLWLINDFKRQHRGAWPFQRDGVAFVSNDDQVVILENGTQLTDAIPSIESTKKGRQTLDLPKEIKYPFWFDVVDPLTAASGNEVAAEFVIHPNAAGNAELARNHIPARFPAVLLHSGTDYGFYYFSGDFCDNPISLTSSYFKGISFFKWLFYDASDPNQRVGFFWEFYRPMMTKILTDYYRHLPKK